MRMHQVRVRRRLVGNQAIKPWRPNATGKIWALEMRDHHVAHGKLSFFLIEAGILRMVMKTQKQTIAFRVALGPDLVAADEWRV